VEESLIIHEIDGALRLSQSVDVVDCGPFAIGETDGQAGMGRGEVEADSLLVRARLQSLLKAAYGAFIFTVSKIPDSSIVPCGRRG